MLQTQPNLELATLILSKCHVHHVSQNMLQVFKHLGRPNLIGKFPKGRPNLIGKFPSLCFYAYLHVNFHVILQVMFSSCIFMSLEITHNITQRF